MFSQGGPTKHRSDWNTRTVPGLSIAKQIVIAGTDLSPFYFNSIALRVAKLCFGRSECNRVKY